MNIRIQIINNFGVFNGKILKVDTEQYNTILEMSKGFYETGFEMETDDDGFIIIPPEIVKVSILKILKIDVQK